MDRLAGSAAADALRSPFVLGEGTRMIELCAAAGISRARVDLQQGHGAFSSIRSMIEADVRGWLPVLNIVLEDDVIEEIVREAEVVLRPFVADDGAGVRFASPALLTTATKPASRPSQS